jgi:ATP sulfurylase
MLDLITYYVHHLASENPIKRDLDRTFVYTVTGNFMQLGHKYMMSVTIYQSYLYLVLHPLEGFVQSFGGMDARIASAKNHNSLLIHVFSPYRLVLKPY